MSSGKPICAPPHLFLLLNLADLFCFLSFLFVLLPSTSVWGFYSEECVSILCNLYTFTLAHFFVGAVTYIVVIWLYASFTHMVQTSVPSSQEMLIARHFFSNYEPVPDTFFPFINQCQKPFFPIYKPVPDTFFPFINQRQTPSPIYKPLTSARHLFPFINQCQTPFSHL